MTALLLALGLAFGGPQQDFQPVSADVVERAEIPGVPPGTPPPADMVDEIAHPIADKLRCPVCQGLSVADSNAPTAVAMYNHVKALVAKGYSEEDIRDFFMDTYGEWIVLDPEPEGIHMLIWLGPGLAAGLGLAWALSTVMVWRRDPDEDIPAPAGAPASGDALDPFEKQLLAQLDAETGGDGGRT